MINGTETTTTNTYVSLYANASIALDEAIKIKDGQFYKTMTSLIFTAFTIEAYVNHMLKDKSKNWKETEKHTSLEKVYELYDILGINLDKSKRPIQSLQRMFDFRNMLAHGKTDTVIKRFKIKKNIQNISQKDLIDNSKSKWEKLNTLENSKIFFADMEYVIKLLHKEIEPEVEPFQLISSSGGNAQVI